jgi:hypothetical protein
MEPAVGDRGGAAMTRPLPTALLAGPVTRVDGRLKVTGRALYAADNAIPNVSYAALVYSSVARGTVERIDAAAAQRNPDVLRVITDFGCVNCRSTRARSHPSASWWLSWWPPRWRRLPTRIRLSSWVICPADKGGPGIGSHEVDEFPKRGWWCARSRQASEGTRPAGGDGAGERDAAVSVGEPPNGTRSRGRSELTQR